VLDKYTHSNLVYMLIAQIYPEARFKYIGNLVTNIWYCTSLSLPFPVKNDSTVSSSVSFFFFIRLMFRIYECRFCQDFGIHFKTHQNNYRRMPLNNAGILLYTLIERSDIFKRNRGLK